MTLAKQLEDVRSAAPAPQIDGFHEQKKMVEALVAAGLLQPPAPPKVADVRPPSRPVRVRWRAAGQ